MPVTRHGPHGASGKFDATGRRLTRRLGAIGRGPQAVSVVSSMPAPFLPPGPAFWTPIDVASEPGAGRIAAMGAGLHKRAAEGRP
jgi:hypothetical protein